MAFFVGQRVRIKGNGFLTNRVGIIHTLSDGVASWGGNFTIQVDNNLYALLPGEFVVFEESKSTELAESLTLKLDDVLYSRCISCESSTSNVVKYNRCEHTRYLCCECKNTTGQARFLRCLPCREKNF